MQIIVLAEHEFYISEAKQLATHLGLNFEKQLFDLSQWKKQLIFFLKNYKTVKSLHLDADNKKILLLIVGEQGISLLATWNNFSPLSINFESEVWSRRLKELSIKNELLAKALGIKKQEPITILDANAGLGQDAFIMAALGCKVWCAERSLLIHCLLSDGFARARKNPALKSIVDLIDLRCIDAKKLIENPLERFDVIYLDPMFPEKKGNALVKKEMQIFQQLLGADEDADELIQAALDASCKRVVIKRPTQSDFALDKKPDLQFEGKSTRFDVYLNHLL